MTTTGSGRLIAGAAIGVAGGVVLGAFLDSVIIGVAVGVGAGAVLGIIWSQPRDSKPTRGYRKPGEDGGADG